MAVFATVHRQTLPAQTQSEALLVADALERIHQGDFEQAAQQLKTIARSSPYADWRLFLRGLGAFYERDWDSARNNWLRLDVARRPARIASALWQCETGQSLIDSIAPANAKVLSAATEIYTRSAIRDAADKITAITQRDPSTTFTASQCAMVQKLRERFLHFDKEFVRRLSQACVIVSTYQPSHGAFDLLKPSIPGPLHDPHWNLLSAMYGMRSESSKTSLTKTFETYTKKDLRQTELSDAQRQALLSVLYRQQAHWQRIDALNARQTQPFWSQPVYPSKNIVRWLEMAIEAYPQHRKAHQQLIEELQQAHTYADSAAEEKLLERQLWDAKRRLAVTFPDEVATTLEVIDHLFDDEEISDARALASQLGEQRLNDPLARALPWKLALLDMRQHVRRKDGVKAAEASLTEAEAHWPSWFPRDLVPYYRATFALRRNDLKAYEMLLAAANASSGKSLATQRLLQFVAAQHLRVSSAQLKPIRAAIDQILNSFDTLETPSRHELIGVLWDLRRTGLQNSGYRAMASKIGKLLAAQLFVARSKTSDARIPRAVWGFLGKHRFFLNTTIQTLPVPLVEIAINDPFGVAAIIDAVHSLEASVRLALPIFAKIPTLRDAAREEVDPFERHRLECLAQLGDELEIKYQVARSQRDPFVDFDFDFDLSDPDDDDECDCARCRAERAAQQERQRTTRRPTSESDQREPDNNAVPSQDPAANLPASIRRIHEKLGNEGLQEVRELILNLQNVSNPMQFLEDLQDVFLRRRLSQFDYMNYAMHLAQLIVYFQQMPETAPENTTKQFHPGSPGTPAPHTTSQRIPT